MIELIEFPGVIPTLEGAGYQETKAFFNTHHFTILSCPTPETIKLTNEMEFTQAGTERKIPISRIGMERLCAAVGYPKRNLVVLPWERIQGDIHTLLQNWPHEQKGIQLTFFNGVVYDACRWNLNKPPHMSLLPEEILGEFDIVDQTGADFKAYFDGRELNMTVTTRKGQDTSKTLPNNSLNLVRMGVKVNVRFHGTNETIVSGFLQSDEENPNYIGGINQEKLKNRKDDTLAKIGLIVEDFVVGSPRVQDAFLSLSRMKASPWLYERLFIGARLVVGEKKAYGYLSPLVKVLEHEMSDNRMVYSKQFDYTVLEGKNAYDAVELLMNHFHGIGLSAQFMGDMFGVLFLDEQAGQ